MAANETRPARSVAARMAVSMTAVSASRCGTRLRTAAGPRRTPASPPQCWPPGERPPGAPRWPQAPFLRHWAWAYPGCGVTLIAESRHAAALHYRMPPYFQVRMGDPGDPPRGRGSDPIVPVTVVWP